MADKELNNLLIVECQKDTYKQMKEAGTLEPDALYCVKGEDYTAEEIDNLIKQNTYHPNIFDIKWSDHLINDIQWLRADTFSWQSGDVYVTAYNTLVEEYSTGTEETEGNITFKRSANGFKITTANMESAILSKYNTDGIAWYYILDTTNKQFKLPRTKFGFEGLRNNVGDDITESLPNINFELGNVTSGQSGAPWSSGALVRTKDFQGWQSGPSNFMRNSDFDFNASRSSSTYQDNAPVQERATQMYLYFYVGEYSRDAIEQTAGITTEQLNAKVDIDSSWGFPSNRYIDLTLGADGAEYTAPANGWFALSCNVGNTQNAYVTILSNIEVLSHNNYVGAPIATCIPVVKGQTVGVGYSWVQSVNYFRFVYAEGEKQCL